jgi:hypothetical protein
MKFKVIVTLLLLAQVLRAQERHLPQPWMPLENRIGLAIGIGKVTYRDKNISPLVYQSPAKNVRLFYALESNHLLFSFDFDVKVGRLFPKHYRNRTMFFHEYDYKGKDEEKKFPAGGSFLGGRVSLAAYYKIESTQHSTFRTAAGVRISNTLFYPQGWTSAGIFNALSIAPEGAAQHRVDGHHDFTIHAGLPVATLLTRLPYHNTVSAPGKSLSGGFLSNTRWTGLSGYIAPSLGVAYRYQADQHWGAGLQYDLQGYIIRRPQTMKACTQSFLPNVYYQL